MAPTARARFCVMSPRVVRTIAVVVRRLSVGLAVVVQGRSLQDDTKSAHKAGSGEDPQEQAIQHHGNVLPVFNRLRERGQVVIATTSAYTTIECASVYT